MKYKCLKCENEFEVSGMQPIRCSKCGAWESNDLMSLYIYKLKHPEIPVEGSVVVQT